MDLNFVKITLRHSFIRTISRLRQSYMSLYLDYFRYEMLRSMPACRREACMHRRLAVCAASNARETLIDRVEASGTNELTYASSERKLRNANFRAAKGSLFDFVRIYMDARSLDGMFLLASTILDVAIRPPQGTNAT